MKRTLCMILALVMLLALCACTSQNNETNNPHNTNTHPSEKLPINGESGAEPSEEEYKLLATYAAIVRALDICEDGRTYVDILDKNGEEISYYDQEALQYCYEKLPQLGAVDKWLNTRYWLDRWNGQTLNWDRQELISSFFVTKDVLLEQEYVGMDAVGNAKYKDRLYFQYDTNGKLLTVTDLDDYGKRFPCFGWSIEDEIGYLPAYTYDESGRVKEIKFMSFDHKEIKYLATPTYDSNGKKVSDTVVTERGYTWKYQYTYEDNRLITVSVEKEESGTYGHYIQYYTYRYTYDNNGNIVKREYTNSYDELDQVVYTYTEGSKVVSGKHFVDGKEREQLEITLDDQGRVVKWEVKHSSGKYYYEQTYGDYYCYIPAK